MLNLHKHAGHRLSFHNAHMFGTAVRTCLVSHPQVLSGPNVFLQESSACWNDLQEQLQRVEYPEEMHRHGESQLLPNKTQNFFIDLLPTSCRFWPGLRRRFHVTCLRSQQTVAGSGVTIQDGDEQRVRWLSVFTVLRVICYKTCLFLQELSKIAMPVVFNEPLSFLQRISEYMEHAHLLHRACSLSDSIERMQVDCSHVSFLIMILVMFYWLCPWTRKCSSFLEHKLNLRDDQVILLQKGMFAVLCFTLFLHFLTGCRCVRCFSCGVSMGKDWKAF